MTIKVNEMSYCPKCGSKVDEEMTFCPKCGAPLKAEKAVAEAKPVAYRRDEKAEKTEKHEKGEKHEKREYGFIGPLVGGLILLFVGLTFYLELTVHDENLMRIAWAFFFVIIGIIIIVAAVYGVIIAGRRHPRT
jgi:uncharacterized membrane protein YvbJ